jgi:hypothetical protein
LNSCQKGKRGEREARDVWREEGFTARREQQYCGNTGDARDIRVLELPDLHIESKRVEAGNPYKWLAQAERDAKPGTLPVVQHKRNHHETIFILPRTVFFRLLRGSDLINPMNQDKPGECLGGKERTTE